MNQALLDVLLSKTEKGSFTLISLQDIASLPPNILSIFLLKCIENLQQSLRVDGFGRLYFEELQKIVNKNLLYTDIKFQEHLVLLKGSIVNQFRNICSEIYIKYHPSSEFEQAVGEATPNAWFRLLEFNYKPFKLVISPMKLILPEEEE